MATTNSGGQSSGEGQAEPLKLSEVRLRRALNLNIICGSMAFIWVLLVQGNFFQGFLVDIGASTWQIGLISTIALATVLVQIPSALLVERIGKRKVYWGILAFTHRFVWWGLVAMTLMSGGVGTWKPRTVILITGLSSVLAHAATPVWFSWMTDLVPAERRSNFFGRRSAVCTSFAS